MTQVKAITLTATATLLVCLVHFFAAVYVQGEKVQRDISASALAQVNTVLPYNADTLAAIIRQWAPQQASEPAETQQQASMLSGFDNARLGDTTVALLAIYQQQKPVAVLALQTADKPVVFVRLSAQDTTGDIALSQINRRDVTITRGSQQVKLRLFNPGSAAAE